MTRLDGWANLLTNVGVEGRDKRIGHKYYGADRVSVDTARELWAGDPEVARLIERPAEDATREGFELEIPGDEEGARKVSDEWRRLGLVDKVEKCLQYRRAYGGGALLVGVDDGVTDLRMPLVEERVRGVRFLLEIEARELTPSYYYADPLAPKFGEVAIWRFTPSGVGTPVPGEAFRFGDIEIHESRLVIFDGIRTTRQTGWTGSLPGWGDSILTRVWAAIRDFAAAFDASGLLVQDFAMAVHKIKGLAGVLAQDKGAAFRTRMQLMALTKSTLGMTLIDADEDYVRTATPVTGLPELLRLQMERVASAAEMPVTLYWGISPGGLNATGESDMRGYYDRTKSMQMRHICPHLERISTLIARGLGVKIAEDKRLCVTPNPLWQQSELEQAQARGVQATTDVAYCGIGILTPDEVRASRFGSGKFSYETSIEDEADDTELPELGDEDIEAMGGAPKSLPNPGTALPNPGTAPTLPGAGAPPPVDAAKAAFNGAQVAAMVDIAKAVALGEIARETGLEILVAAFPVDAETAARMLPEGFKVDPPPPPVIGGGFGASGKNLPQPPAGDEDPSRAGSKTPPKPGALKAE